MRHDQVVTRATQRTTRDRINVGAPVTWDSESWQARAIRRSRLFALDQALGFLEELNLRGEPLVPQALSTRLRGLGITILPRDSPTSVLGKVLVVQEVYLLHPEPIKAMLTRSRR